MRSRGLTLALALVAASSCMRDVPEQRRWPTTLASHPRAMVRLARLMREQFTSPDPVGVERRIRCESRRVQHVLGADFRVREQWLTDSLRMEFTSERFNELGQRLAQAHLSTANDPLCRAVQAEAEGEAGS